MEDVEATWKEVEAIRKKPSRLRFNVKSEEAIWKNEKVMSKSRNQCGEGEMNVKVRKQCGKGESKEEFRKQCGKGESKEESGKQCGYEKAI